MKKNNAWRAHKLVAETIADVAKALNEEEPMGYLIYITVNGIPLLSTSVGDQSDEQVVDTHDIAIVNACHVGDDMDIQLSSEARNDEADENHPTDDEDEITGGAVRTKDGHILSFAGFTEENNELFMLAVAVAMGWLEDATAQKLLDTSPLDHRSNFADVKEIVSFAGVVRSMA